MGQIHIEKTEINGLCIITPTVHKTAEATSWSLIMKEIFKKRG